MQVIKHPKGSYYTEHKTVETTPVLAPMDMKIGENMVKKGSVIGSENTFAPAFEAFRRNDASKFDTAADAQNVIDSDPDAFKGCTVEPL